MCFLCSLIHPACNAHALYYIVICTLSGSTIFFHIISQYFSTLSHSIFPHYLTIFFHIISQYFSTLYHNIFPYYLTIFFPHYLTIFFPHYLTIFFYIISQYFFHIISIFSTLSHKIFPHYPTNDTTFGQKKCVGYKIRVLFLQHLSEKFLVLKQIIHGDVINVHASSRIVPVILVILVRF